MKLKRWLMPIFSLLICVLLFILTGAVSIIFDNEALSVILILMLSYLFQIIPYVTSFFYGYYILKNASHKALFVIYNALLHSSAFAATVFLTKNAFALYFAALMVLISSLSAALGVLFSKKAEVQQHYIPQFENVTMDDPIE
jgi:hypothetical protein